eukprot:gnl/Spiro4/5942_TR3043_c0_g1_i1.p1 gnl/Spiro4/5942_TR3043_c0_g1~~gnl/Spiro4/5942_TR3043_c0_g1_i1.p1  ORF type:complete len:286 (+),score=-19.34 gnl/Spiro4/5942_TR3043_c0_g1_i1:105-860(+)
MKSSLFLTLFGLFCIVSVAFSQEATEGATTEAENNATQPVAPRELVPSPYVSVFSVFPESAEKTFTVGEVVEVVVALSNNGEKPVNVTNILASLRYPQDWRVSIQNFTRQYYGVVVAPGEQQSFSYYFIPDALLDPRTFGLQANVFYFDSDNNTFTSAFYNGTITLKEVDEVVDVQMLFTYVGILAVAVLVGFFAYSNLTKGTKKRAPKRVVETGTKVDVADNEWLQGTSADPQLKQRSKSPKPVNKKKAQ